MTFINDLNFGKSYEEITINKFLQKENNNYKLSSGKFKPYDIINESTGEKYECKSDRWTYRTGNVCIEFQYKNADSGISSTESDFYFYYVVNEKSDKKYERVYKIPTDFIRQLITEKKYHKIQNGGDNWKSKFYLFKELIFSSYIIHE